MFVLFLVAVSSFATWVSGEVTVLKSVQTLYDRSPKLRIKGTGFEADADDIRLEMAASGQPALKTGKDFIITKDEDGLIIKLLSNRKWVNLEDRTPPVQLVLSSVKFAANLDDNLLPEPVVLANVIASPTVTESTRVIYQKATNELRINGTGFRGAKKIDLYFSPPLNVEIDYEIVSPFPLKSDQLVLRIRHGYEWRKDPGPLMVLGVDGGGGPVKLNGEDGVQVADVQADLALHKINVESTATDQLVYHNDAQVYIKGSGFNPEGNKFRFVNGILGKGVNFTAKSTSENLIKLQLTPGSAWRGNMANLPGYLTLLAVDAGEGFVAVGATNSNKGKDVATVFERPNVFSAQTKLYRTHSHEFHIYGVGFTRSLTKTQIIFDPPLEEGVDYTIRVIDRTDLEVTLLDGKSWRSSPGPLVVTSINSRGDDDGWVSLSEGAGVHVAEVLEDVAAAQTGGVEVFPMGVKLYQSSRSKLTITGTGFTDDLTFVFEPEFKSGDVIQKLINKNQITLSLANGKKWKSEPGFIIVKSVKVSGKSFNLGGDEGIRVATILADPSISASQESFHETQSKVIAISGHGFTNIADTEIVLRPTLPSAFKVLAVLEDTIRIQLLPGNDWLPSFVDLKEDGKKIALQVASIDTGAGSYVFETPVVIGNIVKDREGVTCDDTCEFAFDGVCDDGSENEYDDDKYGYADDDLGGYYEDKEEEGAGYAYDDYYANDEYKVSACVPGTDCTDCGGVDAVVDYNKLVNDPDSGVEACTNTCPYARDGVCDDPRGAGYCALGTDCQDCGMVGSDNFTKTDDDGWWDDDDDYWSFNDGNFLDQTKGLEVNRDKVKNLVVRPDNVGITTMFLLILEGMVYTVGAIFAAAALYLGMRYYNGQSLPCVNAFDAEFSGRDMEAAPLKRIPITPDTIRT